MMARQRNHAAERARRWELEQQRALAEGRTPSKARARGHGSHERENAARRSDATRLQRQLNYWTKRSAYMYPEQAYRAKVKEALEHYSKAEVIDQLKRKVQVTEAFHAQVRAGTPYADAARASEGHADYMYHTERDDR